jgi:dihydrofolate synthase / folylpolyglutamate synthase
MVLNSDQLILEREYFGLKLGLDAIRIFLKKLNDPQNTYPVIHVGGTNGKGSTATMIAKILESDGLKVGLFTSPHLNTVRERFQINTKPIAASKLRSLNTKISSLDQRQKKQLTFFEFMTALAFQYFSEEKVDVAVIEVGMGGRLDATNVVAPALSVLTSIGYDHQKHLGKNIAAIAFEKGGIIKEGVSVVSAEQKPLVKRELLKIAREKRAAIQFVKQPEGREDDTFRLGHFKKLWTSLLGSHQIMNAATAVAAARAFKLVSRDAIDRALSSVHMPGRMEVVRRRPFVLIDGAHNPEATDTLVNNIPQFIYRKQCHCLFGVMDDKDTIAMLKRLKAISGNLHITEPHSRRALSVSKLASYAQSQHFSVRSYPSCGRAIDYLLSTLRPDEALVVTGSLFLVAEARAHLQKIRRQPRYYQS